MTEGYVTEMELQMRKTKQEECIRMLLNVLI